MSDNCLFCMIAKGEIPANLAYEDDQILAFHDISPRAPTHILVIPKQHIESLMTATVENSDLLAHMMLKSAEIALAEGLKEGFRLVTNSGEGGRQEVKHLHFHIMGDIRDPGYRPL